MARGRKADETFEENVDIKTKDVETEEKTGNDIIAQIKAEAKEIMNNALKEAAAIVENAKKEAASMQGTTSMNGIMDDETAAMNEKMEEYVTIKLFKDNGRYQDDVFVAVNGEGCSIPRGIPVRVKKKFVAVLDQSDLQDMQTVRMMDEESRKFDEESKRYGM